MINRLRWHLHELDPSWDFSGRSLDRTSTFDKITHRLETLDGPVADLAHRLIEHARRLTAEIDELTGQITSRVEALAPSLLAIPGCGVLTAAKILGETAGVAPFRSKEAYARHNCFAPLPVWSSSKARHRLARSGNRQVNAALHPIALTQAL